MRPDATSVLLCTAIRLLFLVLPGLAGGALVVWVATWERWNRGNRNRRVRTWRSLFR